MEHYLCENMEKPRKRWSPKSEITPAVLKFREKRKWQIALRRYVLERNPSTLYASYFGLDIQNMRSWFEVQFQESLTWEDFGKKWQFEHIIPVTHFDFAEDSDLKMCWNFINLRVENLQVGKNRGLGFDLLAARMYFNELYKKTLYLPCLRLLEKIETIESSEIVSTEKQIAFIIENRTYLEMIEGYSTFEFELLNSGRDPEIIKKELEFFKKVKK